MSLPMRPIRDVYEAIGTHMSATTHLGTPTMPTGSLSGVLKEALLPPQELSEAGRASTARRPCWSMVVVWIVALFVVLSFLPFRSQIPPLVESDYCYQLIAAERMARGEGLTTLPPLAPGQPWEWRGDWTFLTRWPAGYSALVGWLHWALAIRALEAARWIAVASCAVGLVGWFLLVKRASPGVIGGLTAAVAAGLAVGVPGLLNPSTDAILVALLPMVLLLVDEGIDERFPAPKARGATAWRLALAGLLAGGLCWIRYASLFLPLGVGAYLIARAPLGRRRKWLEVGYFALGAGVPALGLVVVNRCLGSDAGLTEQVNLGTRAGFQFSWLLPLEAWRRVTALGFYDHRPESAYVFMLWPVVLGLAAALIPGWRKRMVEFARMPVVGLSAAVLASFLVMIVAATTLFREKFNFAGLDRYYLPVRPLYLLLFVTPIVLVPRPMIRLAAAVPLLVAASWIVHQEWLRPYARALHTRAEVTPSGAWSRSFGPAARELYLWLRRQPPAEMVLVSNFHEWVALETGHAALPIPEDTAALERWLADIRRARRVESARVLFVLDGDNRWRSHWIIEPEEIVRRFRLEPATGVPASVADRVFEYRAGADTQSTSLGKRDSGTGVAEHWLARPDPIGT